MPAFHDKFLRNLQARGLLHQCSNEAALDSYLRQGNAKAYIGFDCTAPSLHIGNLLAIMSLRRLQQAGHQPIIVMGGGTTRIGDPSGKDKMRTILSEEEIEKNIRSIQKTFARFLDMGKAIIINNHEWLGGLNYIDFLRDIGKHFSINRMLTMDSVQLRLQREQPLSFIEFNYMVVQAYDFLHLYREYDCRLQMGGSDQWGNIINGVELARRAEGIELFALTMPLITTQDGAKMGKTAAGAIWLNDNPADPDHHCSPYHYWQFWRNTKDGDVGRFLRIFTELPLDEIARLEKLAGEEINDAKKILANEATTLAHGAAAAAEAAEAAQQGFEEGAASANMPTVYIEKETLQQGFGLLEAYVHAGLTISNSEARRHIRSGAARVNGEPVHDEAYQLTPANLSESEAITLAIGRKNIVVLKLTTGK